MYLGNNDMLCVWSIKVLQLEYNQQNKYDTKIVFNSWNLLDACELGQAKETLGLRCSLGQLS